MDARDIGELSHSPRSRICLFQNPQLASTPAVLFRRHGPMATPATTAGTSPLPEASIVLLQTDSEARSEVASQGTDGASRERGLGARNIGRRRRTERRALIEDVIDGQRRLEPAATGKGVPEAQIVSDHSKDF